VPTPVPTTAVITGGPAFFDLTKRLHNHLHGFDGDGGNVSERERGVYEATLAAKARELASMLRPDDVVRLHDPQTAGLVDAVTRTGATVIWRCHVGLDHPNALARRAWIFLKPYVLDADAYVFSRPTLAWEGLDPQKTSVIHPSIDAFSAKNQGSDARPGAGHPEPGGNRRRPRRWGHVHARRRHPRPRGPQGHRPSGSGARSR
jgi:trehalose synthase